MNLKYLYAFRGLVAFVAFTDLGVAVKAFVEKKCLLNEFSADSSALPRIYGIYAILQALILIHCTLFIHYKPLVSLGVCSLILSVMIYLMEPLIFQSTLFDFRIIFPCILNGITAAGLLFILFLGSNKRKDDDDENAHILKKAKIFKKTVCSEKFY